jgi:hypothetical protein
MSAAHHEHTVCQISAAALTAAGTSPSPLPKSMKWRFALQPSTAQAVPHHRSESASAPARCAPTPSAAHGHPAGQLPCARKQPPQSHWQSAPRTGAAPKAREHSATSRRPPRPLIVHLRQQQRDAREESSAPRGGKQWESRGKHGGKQENCEFTAFLLSSFFMILG